MVGISEGPLLVTVGTSVLVLALLGLGGGVKLLGPDPVTLGGWESICELS